MAGGALVADRGRGQDKVAFFQGAMEATAHTEQQYGLRVDDRHTRQSVLLQHAGPGRLGHVRQQPDRLRVAFDQASQPSRCSVECRSRAPP